MQSVQRTVRRAHKHMPHLGCRTAHQVDLIERIVCQGWLSRAAVVVVVVVAACTGQRQRAVVVVCEGASDPSTWVPGGDTRVGAGDAWEEARTREGAVNSGCQWQLSTAAVNGSCQQWQRRHVQGSGNPSLWPGTGGRREGSVDCGRGMHIASSSYGSVVVVGDGPHTL